MRDERLAVALLGVRHAAKVAPAAGIAVAELEVGARELPVRHAAILIRDRAGPVGHADLVTAHRHATPLERVRVLARKLLERALRGFHRLLALEEGDADALAGFAIDECEEGLRLWQLLRVLRPLLEPADELVQLLRVVVFEERDAGEHQTTAASPSKALASAKKSGTGWTRYSLPSCSVFGPSEVCNATTTGASPGYSLTSRAISRIKPGFARVASIFSKTSFRSGVASKVETSRAISFVSPSLWSIRALTTRIASATSSSCEEA